MPCEDYPCCGHEPGGCPTPRHTRPSRDTSNSKATVGSYKGNPTISLGVEGDNYPFSFGLVKARLIVKHIDDIRRFVGEPVAEPTQPAPPRSELPPPTTAIKIDAARAMELLRRLKP